VKYNEDFEIWETLLNKTRRGEFTFTATVTLNNGLTSNIPMTAISIEEPLPEGGGFFGGTSK
jgi:hypothetical protein